MHNNKDIKKIILSISKILNEPVSKINLRSRAEDFKNWDSLAHIKIIIAVEKIIKKKIPSSKIGDLNSIKAIFNFLIN